MKSIPAEQISRINFFFDVIEYWIVAVSYYAAALFFEFLQIIYDEAAEESRSVFEGRLIYYDFCAFPFDPFHNALNGGLSEVIRVGLHCQSVNADNH